MLMQLALAWAAIRHAGWVGRLLYLWDVCAYLWDSNDLVAVEPRWLLCCCTVDTSAAATGCMLLGVRLGLCCC